MTSGDAITIDYTPLLSTSAQGLQAVARWCRFISRGIDVNSGKQLAAKIWQAKLGSAVAISDRGRIRVLSLPFAGAQRLDDFSGDQLAILRNPDRVLMALTSQVHLGPRGHGPGADICRRARLAAAAQKSSRILRCDSRAGIRGFRHR